MRFIKVPITYIDSKSAELQRAQDDKKSMLDNLIELIVFTPRGSFLGDPDFGFEYWNHEYVNINFTDFNNGQNEAFCNGLYNEITINKSPKSNTKKKFQESITRKKCQESIKRSLEAYDVLLTQVDVSVELHTIETKQRKKIASKFRVDIIVTGKLDEFTTYSKPISFLMEPTVKRSRI